MPAFDSCEVENVKSLDGLGNHAAPRQPHYHEERDAAWPFIACECPRKSGESGDKRGEIITFVEPKSLGSFARGGGHASCVLVPGDCGAQSDQGAPGGEPGRAVRAGAPQAEAGVPGTGGAGSGRPPDPGQLQRRAGVFQQLGAGKPDTEASAGKKFECLLVRVWIPAPLPC